VLEIATHAPKTIETLARTRSLGKGSRRQVGREILAAVAEASPTRAAAAIPAKRCAPGIGR